MKAKWGLLFFLGTFLQAWGQQGSITSTLNGNLDTQLAAAPLPWVAEYRAATERMLAAGEYFKNVSIGEYNLALAARNYAEAAAIQARVRLINVLLTQIVQDQRLLTAVQKSTGAKATRLLKLLDPLRAAKINGSFTASSQQALAILSGVSVDGLSPEDVVEGALLDLRGRNKRFEKIINEFAEISELPASNFEHGYIHPDKLKAIAKAKVSDPRLIPIEDFPGGSAVELYMFAIERNYRFKFGREAYRILGVCLTAIERNALKKVQIMMEEELQPIRNSMVKSWRELILIQDTLQSKESPGPSN